ncbi:MAG: cysteine--tRNA ligase [Piscirickettsiaceae bacterium CG_4_9_14_3_um_filter_43_564]|nr:cysteine--tRNA ligase [Thiomicrospira sp.]OIP95239.1 MAG: cysteine--tRNA ligase [Thiomicrospira sp. CG2_30_44_34]PIQ03937.1 MAG: cysteine--tRNA ligase [Piscirickettsiaceae bacterium CG18_big_fil_WC_8_21_14_2_50_44_103]PIU38536.1 MAG: cysteine--tRNA ligase [Piscirickettsiaceae bacterium CG07_land_8_20_14_0_80_44_28]PIW57949.1 MAG: cysteine--tRNA ligase [Piscirickettsiaceae bacterium CG12_big_fil_rev_8_21_14_0_65_44_934]PIW77474.1 MAG: cysteine--tRNA ligase [Piscirickettsiaceae bacterium CG_4
MEKVSLGSEPLKLYNTEKRQKEIFKPIKDNQVGLYVCGVTVYDYCHVGHARVMVVFDTLVRHLRQLGYDVTYVRNITDIDDKIIKRALENQQSIQTLTQRFIAAMHEDEKSLNVLRPDIEPKATDYMPQIEQMIAKLVEKGFAYVAENGDVYFHVKADEDYGRLSGKTLDDLASGARVEINTAKQDPLDFVLWKASKVNEPAWASPWGEGRPGWHIECSAMSTQCLGNHFDIHGGGMDLSFPHHENEIAQSECATGETYVNLWMHCGFVRIDDEKMSKSLGNFFTIREVLKQYHPEVIRYFLLASHYRSPVNYSEENLNNAKASVGRLYSALETIPADALSGASKAASVLEAEFMAAMNDDLNTPQALAALFELAKQVNIQKQPGLAVLLQKLANQLGLLEQTPEQFFKSQPSSSNLDEQAIEALIEQRSAARQAKDFARSDAIRDELLAQGIELLDSASGTTWRKI